MLYGFSLPGHLNFAPAQGRITMGLVVWEFPEILHNDFKSTKRTKIINLLLLLDRDVSLKSLPRGAPVFSERSHQRDFA